MASPRQRLDALLVSRGVYPDSATASRYVLSGDVKVDGERVFSPSTLVGVSQVVEATPHGRFVSRGGEKLQGAFDAFSLSVEGMRCLDAGASTGGFTDCLLQHGAAHVAAVDVGYGQFAWKLRCDERVSLFERTNIRLVSPEEIGAPFDLVVADVSFAPLRSYAGMLAGFADDHGRLVLLVKPQFELPKAMVGEGGVVRDAAAHREALSRARDAAHEAGLSCEGMCVSPLPGPKGNIEFFALCSKDGEEAAIDIEELVRQGHNLVEQSRKADGR